MIFVGGCVDAAINAAKDNIFIVGGVSLLFILPQVSVAVICICLRLFR